MRPILTLIFFTAPCSADPGGTDVTAAASACEGQQVRIANGTCVPEMITIPAG